jgi:hypothetical protein
VVERDLLEGELLRLGQVPLLVREVGHPDRVLEAGDRCLDLRDLVAAVEVLAVVAIAVDRQQHLRLDLRKTVDHRRRAELRRRARPDRTDAGGR